MELTTHLTFNGRCEEAFEYYARVLGATITFRLPWEGSPMADQAPAEWGRKLLHASLRIGAVQISGHDAPDAAPAMEGFALTLSMRDLTEAERVFAALAEHGKIVTPLQETFWALRFGVLTDQFGVPWMINCEK
ncbi:MAG TPA: glyoxalase/bleomycin resistance/extradiol dioxygenase family protein [Terriglobia bacterium]|nr:glyoxalase/bleomycin resistance/extradiol dioxygenase family protein [Terriglobia bacterium]